MRKFVLPCFAVVFFMTACVSQTEVRKDSENTTAVHAKHDQKVAHEITRESVRSDSPADISETSHKTIVETKIEQPSLASLDAGTLTDSLERDLSQAVETSRTAMVFREKNLLVVTLSGDAVFNMNSATVKTAAGSEIHSIANVIAQHPNSFVRVEGHTDSRGSEFNNMLLSKDRAEAVKNLLIQRGVDASRIEIIPFGESKPLISNQTEAGRRKNRRVEIKIATSDS